MQDYKHIHYDSKKRKSESIRSKKTSLIVLVILFISIIAVVYVNKHPLLAEKIEKIVHKENQQELTPTTRFTFYDILASGEIAVNSDIPVETSDTKLYIQLGAFQNDIDADNYQAEMKLLNLNSKVQSLNLPEKGGRWFIVRIGPIKDDNEMSMIQTQLNQNNIKFMTVSKKD